MNCPACGEAIEPGADLCLGCGEPLSPATARTVMAPPSPQAQLASSGAAAATGRDPVYESRERGARIWGGRCRYALRRTEEGLRMARKTVLLVDNDRPLPTMAFLI